MNNTDTICALASGSSEAAISVIRLSGAEAFAIAEQVFKPKFKGELKPRTAILGSIGVTEEIDEGLMIRYPGPGSYTGEDLVEFNCHGSAYVSKSVLELLISNGARLAEPGEFTRRAFLNGKMDLSQAEAVADLIASETQKEHQVALQQLRGGFSSDLKELREKLMNFASLVELELDFSEEDVEFADRKQLTDLVTEISEKIKVLLNSFAIGNAIKEGIPVTIVGAPNAGKSTLLNKLLNEDKAIVTDIAGTTRDILEDVVIIDGIKFRFFDTAGLRDTEDKVETIGIERALEQTGRSSIVLHIFDVHTETEDSIAAIQEQIKSANEKDQATIITLANKIDLLAADQEKAQQLVAEKFPSYSHSLSTLHTWGVEELKNQLTSTLDTTNLNTGSTVITNLRHYEALSSANESLNAISSGLETGLSGDLLAVDIRKALQYIGEITGEVTPDDILGNIFSKFCIGK